MNDNHKAPDKNSVDLSDPLQLLNNFYREIVLIKRSLEQHNLEQEVSQYLSLSRSPTPDEMAEVISARLQRWIERKRLAASKVLTEKEFNRIDQTLYIAAALADELFILEIQWPGKEYWHHVLLEERIFQSCYAGEQFYKGVIELLNEKTIDSQERSLLAVYFLAMRLGFSGRYRGEPQNLRYVQKQLFKRINGGTDEDENVVCPQNYEYLLASLQEHRLAPLVRWKKTITQLFLGYLLLGWLSWIFLKGSWAIAL